MASSIRKKRNFKGLALVESPLATPKPSLNSSNDPNSSATDSPATSKLTSLRQQPSNGNSTPASGKNYHSKLSEQLANLELGIEYKLDLKNDDLKFLSELGAGNGGTVTKVS